MENLNIIEQAINLAITKGAYNLQECQIIINALNELKININTNTNEEIIN
jgi:hypothetical protein